MTAPAAEAVEYVKVKFNNTMGQGSPYVGAGPEVDKAWRALSYDSKLSRLDHSKDIVLMINSWRSNHSNRGLRQD